jgi:hypothetical protein
VIPEEASEPREGRGGYANERELVFVEVELLEGTS